MVWKTGDGSIWGVYDILTHYFLNQNCRERNIWDKLMIVVDVTENCEVLWWVTAAADCLSSNISEAVRRKKRQWIFLPIDRLHTEFWAGWFITVYHFFFYDLSFHYQLVFGGMDFSSDIWSLALDFHIERYNSYKGSLCPRIRMNFQEKISKGGGD